LTFSLQAFSIILLAMVMAKALVQFFILILQPMSSFLELGNEEYILLLIFI
jgi:hypothetical protein